MALVKCPECGTEVSDQAVVCPKCGFPSPSQPPMGHGDDAAIRKTYSERGKIAAIKHCRELKAGMGLAEAKQHVESLEAKTPGLAASAPGGQGCMQVLLGIPLAAVFVYLILKTWR